MTSVDYADFNKLGMFLNGYLHVFQNAFIDADGTLQVSLEDWNTIFATQYEMCIRDRCNVNSGIHFLEMLGNLERVSDHAMNIAPVSYTHLDVYKRQYFY